MEINVDAIERSKTLLTHMMLGRSAMYKYLASVFRAPPERGFLGLTGRFAETFKNLAEETDSNELKMGAVLLLQYAEYEKNTGNDLILNELTKSYTSLFLLGFNSVPITASAVLSPDGTMKQEPWERVLEAYAPFGFKKPADFKECEDHIFVELLFMKKLSKLAYDLAEKDDFEKSFEVLNAQLIFLENHMADWVEIFSKLVIKYCRVSKNNCLLYDGASRTVNGFIIEDIKLLKSTR